MADRKIIARLATSADGYIARSDGAVDWLERPQTAGDYGMADFFNTIDTILWGRKTYDMAMGWGGLGSFGKNTRHYVFTHHPLDTPPKDVTFVDEPVGSFARRLRKEPGKDIWMMGGAAVIASFLDAGEIDEFQLDVMPALIGEGIPLIAPAKRTVALELIESKAYSDGVVGLHYRVVR
jgi:dihydrofolate reductase